MAKKEKVYEYVELNDRTPIQKLSLGDQIRVLFKRLTYDEGQELKRDDALTKEEMKLRADLTDFVHKATDPLRRGEHRKVKFEVSNKFEPVFDEIINSKRFTNYYNIVVSKPEIEYNIPYFITVEFEVK